jgi:hypothetical protein
MRTRITTHLFGPALAMLLLTAACSSESSVNEAVKTTTSSGSSTAPPAAAEKSKGNALVRVIHAVPGGPAVDIFADGQKVFSGITFNKVTPYKEVSGERHAFRLRAAGHDSDQPLAENSEGLSDGKHYTVVAEAGADNKPTLYIYNDDLTPPSSGKASVRLINASDAEVDVYVREKNNKLFSGINALKETSYSNFDPVTGTLEVRPAGKNNALFAMPSAKLEAGRIYTVLVTGRANGAPKVAATMIEDQLMGGMPANANVNAATPAMNRNTP